LNRLSFFIPFNPPGDGVVRILRVNNLRIAAAMAIPTGNEQIMYSVTLSVSGIGAPVLTNPALALAIGQGALRVSTSLSDAINAPPLTGDGVVLSQCSDQNVQLALNPASASMPQGFSLFVRIYEAWPNVFKRRTIAPPIPGLSPPPQNQDIPGVIYATESGFFNSSFPGVYQSAGLAQWGTRVVLRFPNVPPGVELYSFVTALGAVRVDTSPDGS
jgi:hypothetical protein